MKILLIGGSGFVGRNLCERLGSEHELTIMSRRAPQWLDEMGCKWAAGDIKDKDAVRDVIREGYDTVVDLVAAINQKEQKHRDLNVAGTLNIVNALSSFKSTKLVYISAINSDVGHTEYFATKKEAERNVSAHPNHLIIRPSILYGDDDYLSAQLFKVAQSPTPVFPKSNFMHPVFVRDFAAVFECLLEKTGVYDVCSNEKLRLGDMLNIVRHKIGAGSVMQLPLGIFLPFAPILSAAGVISTDQLLMLRYNYYREDTVLYKYVKMPTKFEEFVRSIDVRME